MANQDSRRELAISARWVAPDAAEVAVSDTGPGLAAEVRDRLFEPFFTTKSKGLGLGLSISRMIVEAHNGCLSIASNPTGGATVRLRLPAERAE